LSLNQRTKDVDYAALGMLVIFSVVFRDDLAGVNDLLSILLICASVAFLWFGLTDRWSQGWKYRVVSAIILLGVIRLLSGLDNSRVYVGIFLLAYLFFSTKETKWARCLRCLSGMMSSAVLFTSFPAAFGIPMAILALVVFIGGLLSIWSEMTLDRSILWFAKRSFRKETAFLILFLAGVTAIGLRQAQVYSDRQFGVSGISYTLAPGGLRQLILSPQLAMRITFKEDPPMDPSQTYIRALALDSVSGFEWSVGRSRILKTIKVVGEDFKTLVALSPRHSQFTPVVDYGVSVSRSKEQTALGSARDNGVFSIADVGAAWKRYEVLSRLTSVHRMDLDDEKRLTQVDEETTQQLLDLALEIKGQEKTLEGFLQNLSKFYQNQGFAYTTSVHSQFTTPAQFLTNAKEGFCEHYAAASATLARLAGFPSRVVSGFLGGTWRASTRTLFVRDLDAHAWNEFWDHKTQRWTRYDAVNFLAPERISLGAASFLRAAGFDVPDDDDVNQSLLLADLMMSLTDFMGSLNSGISLKATETFVEYGEEIALIGAFGLTLSYVVLVRRRHQKFSRRPDLMLVNRLDDLIKESAWKRSSTESVYEWLLRLSTHYHQASTYLGQFAEAHSRYCHSRSSSAHDLKSMKECIARIKKLLREPEKSPVVKA
jgi:transglutaminase-like putative cysteine protease